MKPHNVDHFIEQDKGIPAFVGMVFPILLSLSFSRDITLMIICSIVTLVLLPLLIIIVLKLAVEFTKLPKENFSLDRDNPMLVGVMSLVGLFFPLAFLIVPAGLWAVAFALSRTLVFHLRERLSLDLRPKRQ